MYFQSASVLSIEIPYNSKISSKGELFMKNKILNHEELPTTLKVDQISMILGISKAGAYQLVKSPGFPCIRINKRLIVPRDKFFSWYDKKIDEPL